jgi:hypothetical protein
VLRQLLRSGFLAAGAAAVLMSAPALAGAGWTQVPVPPTGQNGVLLSVSARTDSDAWAVGNLAPSGLFDHWNGSAWQQVPGPSFRTGTIVSLNGVSASGAGDAWAVGFTSFNKHPSPLTAHWNGSSWSQVSSGSIPDVTVLRSVADLGPGDAWAVGSNSGLASGILAHWDGTAWNNVPTPDPDPAHPGLNTYLNAVTALSPDDVWAVGSYLHEFSPTDLRYETYSLHWNGSTWSVVPMPFATGGSANDYSLTGLTALGPGDVWAVGESGDNVGVGGTPAATVIEHWNGTAWSVVPSPTPTGTAPYLTSVAGRSPGDVWAVGYTVQPQIQTLTLHWDGTAWTVQPSPDPATASRLAGVSTFPGSVRTWAVGYTGSTGSFNPLALQHP